MWTALAWYAQFLERMVAWAMGISKAVDSDGKACLFRALCVEASTEAIGSSQPIQKLWRQLDKDGYRIKIVGLQFRIELPTERVSSEITSRDKLIAASMGIAI